MPKVRVEPMGLDLEAKDDESLLQLLLGHDIEISHSCGGMGSCGTCRVYVDKPQKLPPRNELEKEMAETRSFTEKERLSCQLCPSIDMSIKVP